MCAHARACYLRAGLPVAAPDLGVERYLELMGHDKKVEGGQMRFVLLKAIGAAFVTADVPGSGARGRARRDAPQHG